MYKNIIIGLLVPFLGTSLGALTVLVMKKKIDKKIERILTGFAAGVMTSASFFSLLIPAINDEKEVMGSLAVIPVAIGFTLGMLFLLLIDIMMPHMHLDESVEGPKVSLKKSTMLVLAVVIHNIPEGMAVGVLYAGYMEGNAITVSACLALSIGIAIQNFPEDAIISMPLHANGMKKSKASFLGILSGAVEPIAGVITILLASLIVPLMPAILSFAAGAMIYVVVEELIPGMSTGDHSNLATVSFTLGFVIMMMLDVIFG